MNWSTDIPPVPVILMVLEFHLHGCSSLKEKRARLGGLRQRFGKGVGVAVCESDFQNSHTRAQWSFVATASSTVSAQQTLQEIETWAAQFLDAELLSARSFELN